MPRKVSISHDPVAEDSSGGNNSYLDNFLVRVTEDNNLPAEMKRDIGRLRDLDTQGQELFERMQKQSKNHIARAKRTVQSGGHLDDELLLKASAQHRQRHKRSPR